MNNKYLEEFIILMDLSDDWNNALREYFKDYKFRSLRDVFIAWEYFHKKYIQSEIDDTVSKHPPKHLSWINPFLLKIL